MTYLLGRAQKKRNKRLYAFYVCLFVVLMLFWPSIKKFTYKVIEPLVVSFGLSQTTLSLVPDFLETYITTHKELSEENKKLEQKVESLENALADLDAKMRDYQAVTTLYASSSEKEGRVLVMYPLMQDITRIYSTIMLSKGFKDGLDVGTIVYIRGNQAACVVQEVFPLTSKCLLYTSYGVVTEGVTSSSSVVLTLTGRGGHYMADVVRDTPVSKGETVYLRSNPKIVIGTIQEVSNNNQDTSWHIFVKSAYNPSTASVFYVQQ